jgi:hypothetical protein
VRPFIPTVKDFDALQCEGRETKKVFSTFVPLATVA